MAIRWDDPLAWIGKDVWVCIDGEPVKRRVVEVYPNQRCVALQGVEHAVKIDKVSENPMALPPQGGSVAVPFNPEPLFPFVMFALVVFSIIAAYLLN